MYVLVLCTSNIDLLFAVTIYCLLIGQSGRSSHEGFWKQTKMDLTRFGNKVIFMSLNFHVFNLKFIKLKVPDCVHGDEA